MGMGIQGYAGILGEMAAGVTPVDFPITYSAAEIAVGTAMKRHWVGFISAMNPGSDWKPATAADKNVMVYNDGFEGGAYLNPCVRLSPFGCFTEVTKNFRSEKRAFFQAGQLGTVPAAA